MRPEDLPDLLGVALTDEQLAAVTAPMEPGVVVAGAGSGKTTAMAARVVWLVGTGQVRPDQVLGLTFTNKAAAELAGRIRTALARALPAPTTPEEDGGEPTVSTYHAYAGRLVREHGLRIGVEPRARLLADATRFQLADRVVRRARGPFVELDSTLPFLVDDLVQLDGEMSEHLVLPDDVRAEDERLRASVASCPKPTLPVTRVARTATGRDELVSLVESLHEHKARLGVLDFGDQMAYAARLAVEHPTVGELERERFRVVLLDEYQDTSHAQQQLLLGLFGGGHPVTAVGDPCQAIYGWRGASVANIDHFPERFRTAAGDPGHRFLLSQNNRSGAHLLDVANLLSEPLRERHPLVARLVPRPDAVGAGRVECSLHETYAGEVGAAADTVARLVAEGTSARDIAVLVRARTDFPAYHDALVARGVAVEVVGLGGLLSLPEVADVVATLSVLDDSTANPALVRLLTGPRWQVGPRDLHMLGRRALALTRASSYDQPEAAPADGSPTGAATGRADEPDLAAAVDAVLSGLGAGPDEVDPGEEPVELLLEKAVSGVDPVDVVSLAEALDRPGGAAYSEQARQAFAALSGELRELRRHLGEPLLDVLQRVVRTTGLDVEVAAVPTAAATRRADGIGAFLDHAAAFADLDGDPSVRAFLAFLRAANDFERGLDTAAPSPGDSVKLLTVHKAKGLEWRVVVLPNLSTGVFPSKQSRPRATQAASTLPTELRGDAGDFPATPTDWSTKSLQAYEQGIRDLDALEELRLAYVAVTRAKDLLLVSGHWWGPSQVKARGPSDYLVTIRAACEAGAGVVGTWAPEPVDDRNPHLARARELTWPATLAPAALRARQDAATWVREAMQRPPALFDVDELRPHQADGGLDEEARDLLTAWDRDVALLVDEARRSARVDLDVPLPASMSASALVRLARDPDGLARDLARPMPRPPAPAAVRGTRFHAWVEAQFGVVPLIDRTELAGAADDDLDDQQLASLQAAFLAGPYASTAPHRVEAPFQLVLGGRVVRGRIDAVYRTDEGYDVVDWKTGRSSADPLQLAVYRLAWSRLSGVPLERVGAAFYYVATGRVDRPGDLAGPEELEMLMSGAA